VEAFSLASSRNSLRNRIDPRRYLAADVPHCCPEGGQHTRPSFGWISLGHFCRALRTLLLDNHQLWAQTVCIFPDTRGKFLHHAGELPMALNICDHDCSHSNLWVQLMTDNLSHAKSISAEQKSSDGVINGRLTLLHSLEKISPSFNHSILTCGHLHVI
jgi:hypothetical protein